MTLFAAAMAYGLIAGWAVWLLLRVYGGHEQRPDEAARWYQDGNKPPKVTAGGSAMTDSASAFLPPPVARLSWLPSCGQARDEVTGDRAREGPSAKLYTRSGGGCQAKAVFCTKKTAQGY